MHQKTLPTVRDSWVSSYQSILKPKIPDTRNSWSISEMSLSDESERLLADVFAKIRGSDWAALTCNVRLRREESGLFLLAILSDHARRNARGDQIWSCMKTLSMQDSLRAELFQSNGQPKQNLRQLIESTAYHWNLRHVFDIPGHMSWFLTIFLQFGFSLPAAQRRLPFWLSGHLPVALTYLTGTRMQSPAFVLMWQSLRAYRLNHITETKCRGVLERSPWIQPSWIPDLLELARSRLDLMDRDTVDDEQIEPQILGEPRLIWLTGEDPFFRCEILAAATFDLKEACYEIRSSTFDPVRIVQQDEDDYYINGESWVDIPLGRASAQCSLVAISAGAGEEDVATQCVMLWDAHYPISLFRGKSGNRMADPECPVRLDEGSFAIFHESFTISPGAERAFSHQHWWIAALPPCNDAELSISQNDDRVWWPDESRDRRSNKKDFPLSIRPRQGTTIKWLPTGKGPEIDFIVDIPDHAEMRWLRIGNEVIDYEPDGDHRFRTSPFTLRPEHVVRPFYATVGFHTHGRSHRVTQRVRLNCQGSFLENEGKLEVYASHRALNIRNARRFIFHIITPDQPAGEEARRAWILEGGRIVRAVPNRGIQLRQLAGYGAPLELYRGLYNTEEKLSCITTRVRDNGAVSSVVFNETGFLFKTCSPIALSDKHELVAWTIDHQFLRISASDLIQQEYEDTWFCNLSKWNNEQGRIPFIKAIGFFYEGHRLGNWFDRTVHLAITQIGFQETDKAARCAEMLRWFKAPILDPLLGSAMHFLLKRFPGEVVPVWLSSTTSPAMELAPLPVDDDWLQVVSQLIREVGVGELSMVDASCIIEEISPDFDPSNISDSLPAALDALDGISANLIAKIAHLYLSEIRQGRLPGEATTIRTAILSNFHVREAELEAFCVKIGVDIYFLNHLIARVVSDSRNLSESDLHNRDLLLNHRIIRRLLTYRYLSTL